MPLRITQFDWDEENEGHIARHHVTPEEGEDKMPKGQKPPVPSMPSAKQEVEFWEHHTALDYDLHFSSEQLDVHPDARSVSLHLRLPRWLVNEVKEIAREEGIPYQRLIRQTLIAAVENRRQLTRKPE